MDPRRLRIALARAGLKLVDLHRQTGIPYNRLIRIANEYSTPREDEVGAIAEALGIAATELTDRSELRRSAVCSRAEIR